MKAFLQICLVLVLLVGALTGYYFYDQSQISTPVNHIHSEDIFVVDRGASLDETLRKLESAGIIKSATTVRIYMKVTGKNLILKAGDYKFPSPITAVEALKVLESGGIQQNKLTVIEGWTRFDIADALLKIPSLKLRNKSDALKLMDDVSLIKDLDSHVSNLEGYLFPDTYFVQSNTTARQLIEEMIKRFREVFGKVVRESANPKHLTVHETVTAASVIETEAKLAVERPVVASVIFNRLKIQMPLAMDSTIVYASKLAGKWKGNGIVYQSDLDLKSLYNTRKYKGLPPGPVGSPGESSLRAALNPVESNYLYYVREPDRNDGAHNFYANTQGFEAGVAKLRAWESQQKARGLR